MDKKRSIARTGGIGALIAGLLLATTSPAAAANPTTDSPMIEINPSMTELESGFGNPGRLVDEQDQITIGKNGLPDSAGPTPTTSWAADTRWTTGKPSEVPIRGYIDLGSEYAIDAISVWKHGAATELEFSAGTPGDWQSLTAFDGSGYKWASRSFEAVSTRYVAVELTGDHSSIAKAPEIALFGTPTGEPGAPAALPPAIPLGTDQIYPVTGLVAPNRHAEDGTMASTEQWVDEQSEMALPIRVTPTTSFTRTGPEPANQVSMNEIVADLDFRRNYRIEYVAVYVERENKPNTNVPAGDSSVAHLSFSTGKYGDWSEAFEYTTTGSGWTIIPLDEVSKIDPELLTTRYLRVSKGGRSAPMAEIAVFGSPTGDPVPVEQPTPVHHPNADMGQFFGTNSFFYTDIPELMGSGGNARIYSDPGLNGVEANADQTDVSMNFTSNAQDRFYEHHRAAGVEVFPAFGNGIPWLTSEDAERKPIAERLTKGKSNQELADVYRDPAAYTEHASMMFQYAARYGSTAVDHSLTRLAKDVPVRTGMDVVQHYENWNEQDAHWTKNGTPLWSTSFTAEEFAAMTSADFDGHEGTLGHDRGIKNADPNAQLVLGGTAGAYSEYIKAMDYWFKNNRKDGQFAADVINIHHYAGAQAPEKDSTFAQFRDVVEYSENYLDDRDVWVSEFGWDVGKDAQGECSDRCAPDEATQGAWILREYLIGAAAGVDRMQQYMLADVADITKDPTSMRYASSGFLYKDGDDKRTKRPSWYYQLTARSALEGTSFAEAVSGSTFTGSVDQDDVHVLRFTDGENRDVYAAWTIDGTVEDFALPVPGADNAVLTSPENLKPSGTSSHVDVIDGAVDLDVSTTPVFVTVSREGASVAAPEAVVQAASYKGAQSVELTAAEGAEIHYTTDYAVPTSGSDLYEGPVTVNTTGTIRAIAVKDGVSSPVAVIPVVIADLPGGLASLSLDGEALTPSVERAESYYEAIVDKDALSAKLLATAPEPGTQIGITVNGAPAEVGEPFTVDLLPGLNTVHVVATQQHNGSQSYYTIRIARPTDLGIQVIEPVATGYTKDSKYTAFGKLWDDSPTLNTFYIPVNEAKNVDVGGGGASVGYIDLGQNWRNIRLTGTWTQYRGWADGQQTPYAELWWDNDDGSVNTTGTSETRFNFSSAERVGTPDDKNPLWVQDSNLTADPVTPGGRYLMFREQPGSGERAIELALTGYLVEDGPSPSLQLLKPVGAGAVGTAFAPMERLFDGDTAFDLDEGRPFLTDAGLSPQIFAGRPAYIDLGVDWKNLRITQIWGHYRGWSTVTGKAPVDVFWDDDKNDGINDNGITDTRLSLHGTAVPYSAQPQWSLDSDFTDDPLIPQGRYLIIVPKPGGDWRMDELALIGYDH